MDKASVLDKTRGVAAPSSLKSSENRNRKAENHANAPLESKVKVSADVDKEEAETIGECAEGCAKGISQKRGRNNKKLGKRGEDAATAFLIRRGYEIVERNWTCFAGEADIICRFDKTLVFVEVKTRKGIEHGFPSEHVDKSKRNRYEKIALAYISENVFEEMQFRFDVISIIVDNPKLAYVRHYIDAFGVA